MPVSDHPGDNQESDDLERARRRLIDEELELERRARTLSRTAERAALQWRHPSPNQRTVAHRRGNR